MTDLSVKYLGLQLRNPVIVSSSGLTDSLPKIKKLEEFGAGAVVLKSLFEEQINYEAGRMIEHSDYPGAEDYLRVYTRSNAVSEYLKLIENTKSECKIPLIASINCVTAAEWVDFAKRIEEAGADALELNVFFLPFDKDFHASDYEQVYYDLAVKVRSRVKIPVAFKLGQQFTHLAQVVDKLYQRGVNGVVLFNRFYEPDIDIEHLKLKSADVFSTPSDISKTLRWVGILSHQLKTVDIAASTGIHDAAGVVKVLMAGAKAAMVCSSLYKNGPDYLRTIIQDLISWLEKNRYKSISEIQGILNYGKIKDPSMYERSQFMKYFSSYS